MVLRLTSTDQLIQNKVDKISEMEKIIMLEEMSILKKPWLMPHLPMLLNQSIMSQITKMKIPKKLYKDAVNLFINKKMENKNQILLNSDHMNSTTELFILDNGKTD